MAGKQQSPDVSVAEELNKQVSLASDLLAEHQWAQAGEALSVIHLNDKIIEDKERELIECIAQNYSRIKGVERELAGLQLQLKLTSGPKKSALELLRKKIEVQNEKVLLARGKYHAARKMAQASEDVLKGEESVKERLCQELNLLVQQSAHAQLERLEQLTQRMELLNKGFMPPLDSDAATRFATHEQQPQQPSIPSSSPVTEQQSAEAADSAAAAITPPNSGRSTGEASTGPAGPVTPRDSPDDRTAPTNNKAGTAEGPRRPELSSADQQKAVAARARHVSLQPKPRLQPPASSRSSLNPPPPKNSPFQGFD